MKRKRQSERLQGIQAQESKRQDINKTKDDITLQGPHLEESAKESHSVSRCPKFAKRMMKLYFYKMKLKM